ncbi:BNR/Asp-box repeat containing protein [Legionella steelei]|uniref:BNR/Asp-box repeat containing protein n=1 Tax=Legionella steelei TaxID=947033 RepID=A0A0W0ZF77_9GAMM|nr:sialidase family protein [Legionella steelei]KTD67901.1 BNR/Asp-box repeat containing protein [Legionella steelei]
MNKKWIYFLLSSAVFTPVILHAAPKPQPKFSILATAKGEHQVYPKGTITLSYTIINNTKYERTLTFKAIQGVSQGTGATKPCSSPFTLKPGQDCQLSLVIHGNSIPSNGINGGPEICKTIGPGNNNPDQFLCSQPSEEDKLKVTLSPASLIRRVTVGYTTINGQNTPIAFTSTDGGRSWGPLIQLQSTTASQLADVTCDDSGLNCVAVGRTSLFQLISYNSTDGGNSWSSPVFPSVLAGATQSYLNGIACDNTGVNCVAVGNSRVPPKTYAVTYTSMDSGATWSSPILPTPLSGNSTLSGVACSSSGLQCVAVGTHAGAPISYSSTSGGASWSTANILTTQPGFTNTLSSVSCDSSGLTCSAVGSSFDETTAIPVPVTYTTINGGATWSAPILPAPASNEDSELYAVSCSNSGLCTATGYVTIGGVFNNLVYTSNNSGNTWSAPILPNIPQGFDGNSLNGVFCSNDGIFCTTVGSGQTDPSNIFPFSYVSTDGGSSWSSPLLLTVPSNILVSNVGNVSGSK